MNFLQLTDHGKIGSEESLTVIKTTRESNLDHFIQALEVENLHTGHQYLVEMLVEDMEDQNLEKPPPEPPPQNHTKVNYLVYNVVDYPHAPVIFVILQYS